LTSSELCNLFCYLVELKANGFRFLFSYRVYAIGCFIGFVFWTQPLIADFEVSEGIYSQARIEDAESVCLWLGANVMLEYSCEEVCTGSCR
jgi:hypothetical protein